jgi:hypothetical protein
VAQWQFITQARNGSQIADVTGLRDRRLLFQLGQPGMVSASLRVNDPRARRDSTGGLQTGVHEMKVYRNGEALETVFQLTKTDVSGGVDTTTLGFEWQGIASYLQDALVYPQASAYSSTTLPWTWINTYQTRTGGSYGITQGTVTGTPPTRQKTITQETSLFEAIHDLASSGDAFDWTIDTNRAYREWHSQRGSDNGIVLEPGVNVTEWSYTENTGPGEIVTDVLVNGPPGSQQTTASDSTARSTYGRREAALSFFADFEGVSVTDGQLKAHADAAIAGRTAPIVIPQVRLVAGHASIPWGSYWLGDTVTFRVRAANYDFINAPYRIVQIDVSLDENDNESITLGVNAL